MVYYSSGSITKLFKLFYFCFIQRDSTFYINGLFIPRLSLIPSLLAKKLIISPRGMLITETFGKNSLLKRVYLSVFKFVVRGKAIFHATDAREVDDIKRYFGKSSIIYLIPNIPLRPLTIKKEFFKKVGSIRLVYFGLIAQKKGLLELLTFLQISSIDISLDIFGAIKDDSYWIKCQSIINVLPKSISVFYKGHADPSTSQSILSGYDFFILLTKGENFGHAIYESLSVGTPVIISNKTPWLIKSADFPAGWLINNDASLDVDSLKDLFVSLCKMNNEDYQICSSAAHQYAVDFYYRHDFKKEYTALFDHFSNSNKFS